MDAAQEFEESLLTRQRALRKTVDGVSDVQRFYSTSVVFLTGGSGFLGQQLTEKLLRSCNVSKVYMLLRPKKGKDIRQRLDELIKEPVFERLRQQDPNFSNKIIAVQGDVTEIQLGLNDEDWNTITGEVHTIFHVAATTKFDETLRSATMINLRGTRECLKLGKCCTKLRAYVHVSTAFTHAIDRFKGDKLEEKFYECPISPETMISMVQELDDDRLDSITANLISDWPNTYTFTKALAEELVRTTSDGLPICIVRPAAVMCSVSEPSPGWVDKAAVYSALGLSLGVGIGVLHTIHCNKDVKLGIVPCDYVNNAIITAGREAAMTQRKGGVDTKIYTISSTTRNPVTWRILSETMREEASNYISPMAVYYTYAVETRCKLLFLILSLILHIIPAIIADCVCLLMGKERRFLKLATKIHNICNALDYFLNNEWEMMDTNTYELYKSLSDVDKMQFNFDVGDINWSEYILSNYCLGVRKYILKDGLKDTAYGIKKQKMFAIIHYSFVALYTYLVWIFIKFVFQYLGLF